VLVVAPQRVWMARASQEGGTTGESCTSAEMSCRCLIARPVARLDAVAPDPWEKNGGCYAMLIVQWAPSR